MDKPDSRTMPKEVASAANLMVHPLAGAAALSALGVGLASQALGMWMGALAGAAEASERLLRPVSEANADVRVPAKVRARARSMMEEAQSLAHEIAGPVVEVRVVPAPKAADARAAKGRAGTAGPVPAVAGVERPAAEAGRPRAVEPPSTPDDLKAISGIGPKLEQVLNGLGIWTYAQIAAWSAAETAWVDDHLGLAGRIGRDGWIDQAIALAGGQAKQ